MIDARSQSLSRTIADGPGRLVYTSSGRILNGERYTTDVVIQRDGDVPFADVFRSLAGLGYAKLVCAEFHSGEIAMEEEHLAQTTFERLDLLLRKA